MKSAEPPNDRVARQTRRLTILDTLILVVALSVGLVMAREFWNDVPRLSKSQMNAGSPEWVRQWAVIVNPVSRVVAMAMAGLLFIQLRPPRQSLRRLSREPGFVACAAAVAGMAVGGASAFALAVSGRAHLQFLNQSIGSLLPLSRLIPAEVSLWAYVEPGITPAIVAAWLALALGRRWRAVPGVLDRIGCALGAYWLLLYAFRLFLSWFEPTTFWIYPL